MSEDERKTVLFGEGVEFSYPSGQAVLRGVNLSLSSGTMTALVGSNGAGKTTLLRLLAGLLTPAAGTVQRFDASSLGALLGEPFCWRSLRVTEWLDAFAGFYPGFDPLYRTELLRRLALDPAGVVKTLSSGNLQKLHIVRALQHRPQLMLLDEPTSRLDPLGRKTFWEILRETTSDRCAVLISSHQIEEVERVVDEVLFLEEGIVSAPLSLRGAERGWRIEVIGGEATVRAALREMLPSVALQVRGEFVLIDGEADADRRAVLLRLIESGLTPERLGPIPLSERWEAVR